jgi:hypothetical protein
MHIIRAIAHGADSTQHFAHSAGRFNGQYAANKRAETLTTHSRSSVVFDFRTALRSETGRNRLMEDRGTRERLGPREQYGNNLGRKPSQMIPSHPKSALH